MTGDLKINTISGHKQKYSLSDGILLASFLALLIGIILAIQYQRLAPAVFADELGYITAAKLLSGRLFYTMQGATFYHFGYAIFLVPASWITDNPEFLYRLFMVVNGLFVIGQFFLLQHIGQMLFSLPRKIALFVAFSLSIYFPFILQVGNVWTSVCAGFFYTCVLWVFVITYRRNDSIWRYIACGALTGFLFSIHPSMIGVVVVGGIIPLVWAWRSKTIKALFSLTGVIPVFLLTQQVNRWITHVAYSNRDGNGSLGSGNLHRYLDRITSIGPLLKSFSGQLINSFISSGGLFFIGVFALVLYLIHLIKSKKIWTWQGIGALFFFFSSLSIYVLSIISMTNTLRWDHLFYGRYVDVMMPAYIFLAIIFIVRWGKQHKIFLAVVVPILFVGLNILLRFLEPRALLRPGNAWRNALPMTAMSVLLPDMNFKWLILLGLLEYMVVIGGTLVLSKGLSVFANKYSGKKGWISKVQSTFSDSGSRLILSVCIMFSLMNVTGIVIINERFIPQQRILQSENVADGVLSHQAVRDFITQDVVAYSEEAFNRKPERYYALQYRYNCQFRFPSQVDAHEGVQYYITDQLEFPVPLFGSWSQETASGVILHCFPNYSFLHMQMTGLDQNNRIVEPVHINNLTYTLPEEDKYFRIDIGSDWNPFYTDPDKLNLTLTINGIETQFVQQVEDSYYFSIPDGLTEVTQMDINCNLFSLADFGISTDTTKMGVSVKSINTASEIETKPNGQDSVINYVLGDSISFTTMDAATDSVQTDGFYSPDSFYTWASQSASVMLKISPEEVTGEDLIMTVQVSSVFLPPNADSLETYVLVNGQQVGVWQITEEGIFKVKIPSVLIRRGEVKITFWSPEATSPLKAGTSTDQRVLSFALATLKLGSE